MREVTIGQTFRHKYRKHINGNAGPAGGHFDPHRRPVHAKVTQLRLLGPETGGKTIIESKPLRSKVLSIFETLRKLNACKINWRSACIHDSNGYVLHVYVVCYSGYPSSISQLADNQLAYQQ